MTARPNKPTFLLTKGERNALKETICTDSIENHYRMIAGGLYAYDGLPDGCPRDFIESTALFYSPGCGCKPVRGMGEVILPIKPANLSLYGTPWDWVPEPVHGSMPFPAESEILKACHEPALWIGSSTFENIEPYIQLMSQTLKVLHTNIFGLSQPVMISGLPNVANLKGLILKDELIEGQVYLPVTDRNGVDAQVLDLKATDHTQNLISTIDWCDARILEIMASSNGVQKSSGITTMETVSGVQSVIQQFQNGLELRKDWCDRVNDRFGMSLSVKPGEGIKALTDGKAEEPRNDDDDKDGGNDE